MSPQRIQRRRTKGWKMPKNAVFVGRPGRWGNPWRVGDPTSWTIKAGGIVDKDPHPPLTVEQAVESFRHSEEWHMSSAPEHAAERLAPLRGKDLACWCPLDQPCHADVLIALANPPGERQGP